MKIRLNDNIRGRLIKMIDEKVEAKTEADAITATYKIAMPLVRAAIIARYPQKDMKILQKYEQAGPDTCVRVNFTAGGVNEFKLAENDGLLTPGSKDSYGCRNRIYNIDETATDAVQNWLFAVAAHKKAVSAKHEDYMALIRCSNTLEDVESVWPEASEVRVAINSTMPVLLSNDVVARIKADVATRTQAAE